MTTENDEFEPELGDVHVYHGFREGDPIDTCDTRSRYAWIVKIINECKAARPDHEARMIEQWNTTTKHQPKNDNDIAVLKEALDRSETTFGRVKRCAEVKRVWKLLPIVGNLTFTHPNFRDVVVSKVVTLCAIGRWIPRDVVESIWESCPIVLGKSFAAVVREVWERCDNHFFTTWSKKGFTKEEMPSDLGDLVRMLEEQPARPREEKQSKEKQSSARATKTTSGSSRVPNVVPKPETFREKKMRLFESRRA